MVLFPMSDKKYKHKMKRVILGYQNGKDQNIKAKEACVCKGRQMLKVGGSRWCFWWWLQQLWFKMSRW